MRGNPIPRIDVKKWIVVIPEYPSCRFIQRSGTLNGELRDSKRRIAIPQPRTNFGKRSFSYLRGCFMKQILSSGSKTVTYPLMNSKQNWPNIIS